MNFDWIAHDSVRLAAAILLGAVLGWDREKSARGPGLRTFPLVAAASCAFTLFGVHQLEHNPEAVARILQGVMTGIGFIGAGAIIKHGHSVHGTATAATVWCTGAIGAATALGEFFIALVTALLALSMLRMFGEAKSGLEDSSSSN